MLSSKKLTDAVAYNYRKAHSVGWPKQFQVVSSQIDVDSRVDAAAFAQAVATWQSVQKPPLKVDGKLGNQTFQAMKSARRVPGGTTRAPDWIETKSLPVPEPNGKGPRWLQYAQAEMDAWNLEIVTWTDDDKIKVAEKHMSRDEDYFLASPYFGGKVKPRGTRPDNSLRRHWCAAFVNFCLHSAGYSHTGSAGAHSFITRRLWRFDALKKPKPGCVVAVGSGKRASHVGFIWSSKNLPENPDGNVAMTKGRVLQMLGGNQRGERVTIRPETKRLMAVKGYNGVTSPYLWPRVGNPNCNLDPSTEQPHFCGRTYPS